MQFFPIAWSPYAYKLITLDDHFFLHISVVKQGLHARKNKMPISFRDLLINVQKMRLKSNFSLQYQGMDNKTGEKNLIIEQFIDIIMNVHVHVHVTS